MRGQYLDLNTLCYTQPEAFQGTEPMLHLWHCIEASLAQHHRCVQHIVQIRAWYNCGKVSMSGADCVL